MKTHLKSDYFEFEGHLWFSAADICAGLEIKNLEMAVNGNPALGDSGLPDDHKVFAAIQGRPAQWWLTIYGASLLTTGRNSSKAAKCFNLGMRAYMFPEAMKKAGMGMTYGDYLRAKEAEANPPAKEQDAA